jgi:hypothetical protein
MCALDVVAQTNYLNKIGQSKKNKEKPIIYRRRIRLLKRTEPNKKAEPLISENITHSLIVELTLGELNLRAPTNLNNLVRAGRDLQHGVVPASVGVIPGPLPTGVGVLPKNTSNPIFYVSFSHNPTNGNFSFILVRYYFLYVDLGYFWHFDVYGLYGMLFTFLKVTLGLVSE